MRHPFDKYRVRGHGPVERRVPEDVFVRGRWKPIGLWRVIWWSVCIIVYRWTHPGEYR